MREMAEKIHANFLAAGARSKLDCFTPEDASQHEYQLQGLKRSEVDIKEARHMFDEAQQRVVKEIEANCHAEFLASDHFSYIVELKAKEGIVAGLPDFRLIRVLGQGGFGQVLEVVKRDCGKRYAMKVRKTAVYMTRPLARPRPRPLGDAQRDDAPLARLVVA